VVELELIMEDHLLNQLQEQVKMVVQVVVLVDQELHLFHQRLQVLEQETHLQYHLHKVIQEE
tara:strand:- start:475 stop:660 length:186 start_codon:yes stop_codon:yes gene_type:complete